MNLYIMYTCFSLSASVRAYLGLQEDNLEEINPDSHPDYKVNERLYSNGT